MRKEVSLEDLQKPFRTGHCAVHCVSLRGISHETNGLPMQDSYAATELENGWIVPDGQSSINSSSPEIQSYLMRFRG